MADIAEIFDEISISHREKENALESKVQVGGDTSSEWVTSLLFQRLRKISEALIMQDMPARSLRKSCLSISFVTRRQSVRARLRKGPRSSGASLTTTRSHLSLVLFFFFLFTNTHADPWKVSLKDLHALRKTPACHHPPCNINTTCTDVQRP